MKEQKMSMKELPSSEQPYEKAELYGIRSLSDAELLAVILRTGSRRQSAVEMARGLLSGFPGRNIAGLFQVTAEELREIDGIGKVKAVQLLALGEIVKRMMKSKVSVDSFCCTERDISAEATITARTSSGLTTARRMSPITGLMRRSMALR